jgi:GNAT superfamily N-acetyltransferase
MAEMDPPTLHPLHPGDPAEIAAAFAAIGWSKPRELYERYLAEQEAGQRHVWVARRDGRFAGYVTLSWQPAYPPFIAEGIPEIQDFNVLPALRRRGIGSALMGAAESAAGERAAAVGLAVGLCADYGAAQRLYVRRGYVPDGRGIAYRGRALGFGERVTVDDDLVLCFTKTLAP